jgi:uncharacterized membrane protein
MVSAVDAVRRPPLSAAQIAAGVVQTLFYLAYPFVLYFAYTRLETRGVGALLLGLYAVSIALRVRGPIRELWSILRQHLGLAALIGLAIATDERIALLLLPSAASLYLLWTFARSLRRGPPMIERFARLVEDDLPDFCVPYCRKVTLVWCVFLASNTAVVAGLALAGSLEWWALYTGFVFYLALGTLLGIEFVVRKLWFRYYGNGLADRLFAAAFPPQRTANGRRSLDYVERRQRGEASREPSGARRPSRSSA